MVGFKDSLTLVKAAKTRNSVRSENPKVCKKSRAYGEQVGQGHRVHGNVGNSSLGKKAVLPLCPWSLWRSSPEPLKWEHWLQDPRLSEN